MRPQLFVVILLTAPLWVQQRMMNLTLAEAERLAIQNSPQFAAVRLNAAAAYQVPRDYRVGLAPFIAGSVTGVGTDSRSLLAAGGFNNPAVYNRLGSGLTISKLVTRFGRRSLKFRQREPRHV